jgi:hypothetical protein
MMKQYVILMVIIPAALIISGCAFKVGNVAGVINPFIIPAQTDGYYQMTYQNVPVCRPWYGRIVCENVVVPQQVYYSHAPFNPGYNWQYWYTVSAQPGFVFFFSSEGRHHRHRR